MSRARTCACDLLYRWMHVVVHRDHHRGEHNGIVDEVQLDSGNPDLSDARRRRRAEQVMARERLIEEQAVLDVMPELDPESDHPPRVGAADKSSSQHP